MAYSKFNRMGVCQDSKRLTRRPSLDPALSSRQEQLKVYLTVHHHHEGEGGMCVSETDKTE